MHAGCTANVVMITKAEILCANAGDSRAVLSKKGKVKDLSVDHKPDTPSEKRRIERANGFVEENRVNGMLALSRSIGDFEYKTNSIMKPEDQIITALPDITIEKITNESDFIVCACDGIWDCMSSQDAVNYVVDKLKKKKGKDSL
jgi:protein phosphatase 2C family protein 2/3